MFLAVLYVIVQTLKLPLSPQIVVAWATAWRQVLQGNMMVAGAGPAVAWGRAAEERRERQSSRNSELHCIEEVTEKPDPGPELLTGPVCLSFSKETVEKEVGVGREKAFA